MNGSGPVVPRDYPLMFKRGLGPGPEGIARHYGVSTGKVTDEPDRAKATLYSTPYYPFATIPPARPTGAAAVVNKLLEHFGMQAPARVERLKTLSPCGEQIFF